MRQRMRQKGAPIVVSAVVAGCPASILVAPERVLRLHKMFEHPASEPLALIVMDTHECIVTDQPFDFTVEEFRASGAEVDNTFSVRMSKVDSWRTPSVPFGDEQ